MRTLCFLLQKEFKQIFRNKSLLPLIFVAPVFQLLILPLAADYQVRNINIAIVDNDKTGYSQNLVSQITASGYFNLAGYCNNYNQAIVKIENGQADIVLEVPAGFERELIRRNPQKLFVAINAINGVKANLGGVYLSKIIAGFNANIIIEMLQPEKFVQKPQISITFTNWFNPFMNYRLFMVPGILVLLVTMVGAYMCALNIVKEKELGTIEQINVTPIKKYQFILGKLIPFLIIGLFVFTVGLFLVGRLVFGVVTAGSVLLLYTYLIIYLVALLGFGLLVSTYSQTQQQAMSVAFFFMMVFILMSGLFTPIDSMPRWAYIVAKFNPVTYFIDVVRMVIIKGSGFIAIKNHFLITAIFAIVLNAWAILNYKKTS